jgi:hypothetical protein
MISIREQLKAVNYDTSKFLEAVTHSAFDLTPEQLFKILNDSVDNLSTASVDIEQEVQCSQMESQNLESDLYQEIDKQSEKLAAIQEDVEAILKHFEEASSGAVRLGDRLNACESEREKLQFAEDLIMHIQFFEQVPPDSLSDLQTRGTAELLGILPESLREKNWGEISRILFNLRRILYEISSDEVRNAEVNIRNLSEAVELVLLEAFEESILDLIEDASHMPFIKHAQSLAQWLHLFNHGSTLQKRFIFSVVERRIPVAKFFRHPSSHNVQVSDKKKSVFFGKSKSQPQTTSIIMESTTTLVDHLSELFVAISDLCQEQFSIIRIVFPSQSVEKVTKMLITRIFNDPAFGIQARVDTVLRPKAPASPLSLPEYLDALVTVREKLSALHLMLLEYCTGGGDDQYADIDAELEATSQYATNANIHQQNKPNMATLSSQGGGGGFVSTSQKKLEEQLEREVLEKRQKTEELQAFLEDQVAQVFQVYLHDYFEKEIMLMKHNLVSFFVHAAGDYSHSILTKVAEGTLPKLRFDKISSIQQLVNIVTRNQFIQTIFYQGADTIDRMVNIGRDDEKKLPVFIKDVFLTECMFITESVFVPWAKAIRALVGKHSASRQQTSLAPPSPDFLTALSCLYLGVKKFRMHFDDVFSKPLSVQPNALTVCQESRRLALKTIDKCMKEAVQSWITAIVFHYKKVLEANTKKHDFAPRYDSDNVGLDPTAACRKVCEHLLDTIHSIQEKMTGVNTTEIFWKPLGRQFVAVLIAHIRRHKVSDEGSFVLVRDMDEYHKVFVATDCMEAVDLISCLREVMYIYLTPADNVVKMVSEDLRHLNTHVVLVLVRSRADYAHKAGYDVALNDIFAAFKADSLLPWEIKNSSINGPASLRKVAVTHKGATAILKRSTYDAQLKNKRFFSPPAKPSSNSNRSSGYSTNRTAPSSSLAPLPTESGAARPRKPQQQQQQQQQQEWSSSSVPPHNTRRPAPKTSKIMSPSTASAKSTMFNKVSSVFKFKS